MNITMQGTVPDAKNAHVFQTIEQIIAKQDDGTPLVIGITGAGGAGKTTLATNLCAFIGPAQSLTMDLDDYLLPREYRAKLEVTGYNPLANKLNDARTHLEQLKQNKRVTKPTYDHQTGKNGPDETKEPKLIVIVEGVTTLYPELRELTDISVFLDAPDETQIKSRITRDVNERGYTQEEALKLFKAILPDYQRFIEPTKKFADIVYNVSTEYIMTQTHLAKRFG